MADSQGDEAHCRNQADLATVGSFGTGFPLEFWPAADPARINKVRTLRAPSEIGTFDRADPLEIDNLIGPTS